MSSSRSAPDEVRLGHPARTFTLALLVVGGLLLLLQWSGLVQPRVEAVGAGTLASVDGQVYVIPIRNDAPISVDVEGARWPVDGGPSDVGLAPSTSGSEGATVSYLLQPLRPFVLGPGETAWIGVAVAGCHQQLGDLTLEVRTTAGLHRDVRIDARQPLETCP